MRTTLVLVLLFGLQSILFAQEELIELNNEPIEFEADGFFIKKITDAREEKDNIGFVQKGVFKKKKVNAGLKGGLENSIQKYLEENFTQDHSGAPIVIHITELQISETTGLPIKGKAEIKLEFFREKDGSLGKLYAAEAFVEKPAVNVTATHEERIREVIVSCLGNFIESDWKTIEPAYFREEN
ncbi:MAG: hypothetical protein ACOCWK_00750 [Tangfeifania sp.]